MLFPPKVDAPLPRNAVFGAFPPNSDPRLLGFPPAFDADPNVVCAPADVEEGTIPFCPNGVDPNVVVELLGALFLLLVFCPNEFPLVEAPPKPPKGIGGAPAMPPGGSGGWLLKPELCPNAVFMAEALELDWKGFTAVDPGHAKAADRSIPRDVYRRIEAQLRRRRERARVRPATARVCPPSRTERE